MKSPLTAVPSDSSGLGAQPIWIVLVVRNLVVRNQAMQRPFGLDNGTCEEQR
jgi:hypothetical protein